VDGAHYGANDGDDAHGHWSIDSTPNPTAGINLAVEIVLNVRGSNAFDGAHLSRSTATARSPPQSNPSCADPAFGDAGRRAVTDAR